MGLLPHFVSVIAFQVRLRRILDFAVFACGSREVNRTLCEGSIFIYEKRWNPQGGPSFFKEGEGFEPSVLLQTPVFEAGSFDHSDNPPKFCAM